MERDIKPYYQVNGELTVVHGLLMRGTIIVIPKCLQQETLEKIHEGHKWNQCPNNNFVRELSIMQRTSTETSRTVDANATPRATDQICLG